MKLLMCPSLCVLLIFGAVPLLSFSCSDAFSVVSTRSWNSAKNRSPVLCRGGGSENDDIGDSELISTLARWNREWEIQQRAAPSKSRWTKLILPKHEDKQDDKITEEEPGDHLSTSPILPQREDIVYLLEPPFSQATPSCLILFCGGAGLGQFPHIAYNELLLRVSNKLNAAVLAVPYPVGLDHFKLAQQTGEHLRRATLHCRNDRSYSESMPIYSLCHSLGCKLQTIYLAATQDIKAKNENDGDDRVEIAGMGWISFNNFSFRQTLEMASTFANELRSSSRSAIVDPRKQVFQKGEEDVLRTIFNIAETVVNVVGLDFSPNAPAMERLIRLKFGQDFQQKTRLFVFDDDQMDNSREFLENCQVGGETRGLPSVSGLSGGHLTPVFFKLSVDDLPEASRGVAREALGGWQSASFGNEVALNALVEEVCDWILGKGPSRPARWQQQQKATPLIAGGAVDAQS
jgi:hypothetical protein